MEEELTEELAEAGSDTVYRLYGMLMHQFQRVEMNLWVVKALHFKPGVQLHQAFAKLEAWDAKGMFGAQVGELKDQEHWPDGMVAQLVLGSKVRNYLAHRFLREFFVARESLENYDRAIQQLYAWLEMVTELDEELEAHVSSLEGGDMDPELSKELEQFFPESWPLSLNGDPDDAD